MANEVDNRVVQLEMDNGSFEKGANQSIKTLDKLDNALNLKNGKRSFSEVEEAAAKCDFKPLIEASKTAVDYMSTLGNVATTVIQNITNRAVDAGISIAKSLSIDQITTGFSKYEQKTANVQTLINSTGKSIDEINAYLDRLMWFSDETSYGFTDMTQALSTMVSAGGDIDKLVPMIEGMANATAFAGKGAAEFNRVIYNLNQSYSAGSLQYMDWKSVMMAGANSKQLVESLIRAGEEAGTIKKGEVTVDNFANTLSKKWANREVMEKGFGYFDEMTQKAYEMIGTLDEQGNTIDTASRAYEILSQQYSGVSLNAAKAAQEAKSFTEAIDSTKDAVSSGWMRTFEIIFGNYEQAKELWTDVANGLWDIFAGGFEERNNLLEQVFQHNPVDDYATSLEKAGVKFDDFKAKMKAAYRETGNATDRMSDKDFEEMTAGADNFSDLLKQSWVSSALLEKTIGQFAPNISQATSGTKKLGGNIQELLKDVNSGKYGYGVEEQQKKLIEAGFDGSSLGSNWLQQWYNTVASGNEEAIAAINGTISTTEEATEVLEDQTDIFDDLATKAKEFDNGYYSQNSGRTIVLDGIKNVLGAIEDRLGAVKKAWDKVFPKMTAEHLKNILITFHAFTEQLKMGAKEGQIIEAVATKVFTVLSKIRDIFIGIGRVGLSAIKLAGRFGEWLLQLEPVQQALAKIKEFFGFIDGNVMGGLDSFIQKLSNIATYLDSLDDSDFDKLPDKFKKLAKYFAPFVTAWRTLKAVAEPVVTSIGNFLLNVGPWIYTNAIVPFVEFINEVINSDKPIETLIKGFKDFGKTAFEAIQKVWNKLKTGNISDVLKKIGEKFPALKKVIDAVSEAFKKLTTNADGTKKSLDFGKVISAITFAGLIAGIAELGKVLTSIQNAADTIKTTFSNLNKFLAGKFGNTFQANVKAITAAIVALAASVIILSLLPAGKMWSAVVAIGALMTVLVALSMWMAQATKKFSKAEFKKINGLIKPMLGIAASILILSFGIKKAAAAFADCETFGDTITRVIGILALFGGLGLEIIGFAALMSMMKGKVEASALMMVLIATAIFIMASALNLIKDIKLSDDATSILGLLTVTIVIVAIISAIGNAYSKGSEKKLSSFANIAITLAALAAALYIGLKAAEMLKTISLEDIYSHWQEAVVIVAVIIGIVWLIQKLGSALKPVTDSIAKLSVAVLAMIGAMYLVTLLVGKLNAMTQSGDLGTAVFAMALIAMVVGALMLFVSKGLAISGNNAKGAIKMAASVLVLTIAIATLVGVLKVIDLAFGDMEIPDIAKIAGIMTFIAILVGGLAIAVGKAGKLGEGKGTGVLIAAIAGVVALAAVMVILSNFSWQDLIPGIIGIVVAVIAIGGLMLAIAKAVSIATKEKGGLGGLIATVFLIAALGASLAVLSNMPLDGLAYACIAMTVVMVALAGCLWAIGNIKFSTDTLMNVLVGVVLLAAITAAIALIAPAMEKLAALPSKQLLANVGVMLLAVLGLAIIAGVLAGIMVAFPPMVIALLVVAGLLVAIGVLFVAFAFSMSVLANVNYQAIATGLAMCAGPMFQVGDAGLGLILGAVGVALFAVAIWALGAAGQSASTGIVVLGVAIEYLLGILSAIGNAIQNSNGNIISALANLNTELSNSADNVLSNSGKISEAIQSVIGAGIIDTDGVAEDVGDGIASMGDAIEGHSGEVKDATVGVVTSAGEAAVQESEAQGKSAGEAFAAAYAQAKIEAGENNPFKYSGSATGYFQQNPTGTSQVKSPEASKASPGIPSWLSGLTGDFDPNQLVTMISEKAGGMDLSSITNVFGGKLTDGLSQYISGEGMQSILTNITGSMGEGDFSIVTDNISKVFTQDLSTSLSNMENTDAVKESVSEVMDDAVDEGKKVDSSPVGKAFGDGVVQAIKDCRSAVVNAAKELASAAMKAFTDNFNPTSVMGVSEMADYEGYAVDDSYALESAAYTITPVLDMSEVYDGLSDADTLYSPVVRPTLDMSGTDPAYANVSAVARYDSRSTSGYKADTETTAAQVGGVTFTQNNYSPKNLSKVDIYRQTRNQLDQYERMIKKR